MSLQQENDVNNYDCIAPRITTPRNAFEEECFRQRTYFGSSSIMIFFQMDRSSLRKAYPVDAHTFLESAPNTRFLFFLNRRDQQIAIAGITLKGVSEGNAQIKLDWDRKVYDIPIEHLADYTFWIMPKEETD